MKLSRDAFERAGTFVKANGRELDRRLYDFYFGNERAEYVLVELGRYQNENGGFGHGLEPDIRTPASSPIATTVGLQYCQAVQAPDGHPVVTRAIRYLLDTFDSGAGYWPATFMDVNDAPHAPWWHLESPAPPSEEAWPNPSAEILGYLYAYPQSVPDDFRQTVRRRAEVNLAFGNHLLNGQLGLFNLLCWQRATPHLPDELRTTVLEHIHQAALRRKPLTKEKLWVVPIHDLAPTPQAPFAKALPQETRKLLELEIARQALDGGWYPTWEWGQYPQAWDEARLEWAAKITVETLHTLQAFAMLD
jgi:hypothetical protein